MAYSDKEAVDAAEYVLAADKVIPIEARNCGAGSIEVVWSNAAATDGAVKIQQGFTPETAKDIAGASATIGSPAGSALIPIASIVAPMLYVVLTKNTETTAKVTVRHYLKGNR